MVENKVIPDPYWIAGFTSEGCFFVDVNKSQRYKAGGQVLLRFYLTQHSRDEYLMRNLLNYLGVGKY